MQDAPTKSCLRISCLYLKGNLKITLQLPKAVLLRYSYCSFGGFITYAFFKRAVNAVRIPLSSIDWKKKISNNCQKKKKSMGWSQLTKCRALKVRHLVPETDPLIQIKNKEKIMKNLVPDSIKYPNMSSFTYSSYPTKATGITHLKNYLYAHRRCQRRDWKWLQEEKLSQSISGGQAAPCI